MEEEEQEDEKEKKKNENVIIKNARGVAYVHQRHSIIQRALLPLLHGSESSTA